MLGRNPMRPPARWRSEKIEAVGSSEMVPIYQTTWCHIPEDRNPDSPILQPQIRSNYILFPGAKSCLHPAVCYFVNPVASRLNTNTAYNEIRFKSHPGTKEEDYQMVFFRQSETYFLLSQDQVMNEPTASMPMTDSEILHNEVRPTAILCYQQTWSSHA
jgi:hypothetical protein